MTESFKDIVAWQKAHEFVVQVYIIARDYPAYERYGLSSQFQRAAVSIAANIAEGYRKIGKNDKLKFMNIAQGSLEECRYYILLSHDLGYINSAVQLQLDEKIEDVSRLLNAYCKGIIRNNY